MKHWIACALSLAIVSATAAQQQEPNASPSEKTENANTDAGRALEAESAVTTNHEVTINGERIPYRATAGTQPVWNEDGKPIASLFYVYYERSDIEDRTSRPLFIPTLTPPPIFPLLGFTTTGYPMRSAAATACWREVATAVSLTVIP